MQPEFNDINVWEAIRGRRSVGKVKSDPIGREQIEKLLEAASWAPSHHGTEPWRFFVMTGAGRQVLADAYSDIAAAGAQGLPAEEVETLRKKQESKAFRAPLVIAVAASPSKAEKVKEIEELAAAHAAVQNMLLAAHSMGLGAIWRTGEPAYHPRMKRAFGLTESEHLVGLVYIGYPVAEPHAGRRQPISDKTVWLTT
ncbi:nitroreductase family protein [Paenibacillus xerothermodurans]|uniref:Putative NAD(P)H nitroreductase n=1 Tax=Paenibacillus xerothermodurans TaxID=1977292 RepID=A0A2W1P4R8_PAEXE|nr:nitroreductase [Paenibacillus xerothermodurans]PZE22712.1 nitroreductase [Paenibacillus xerothermodurans]